MSSGIELKLVVLTGFTCQKEALELENGCSKPRAKGISDVVDVIWRNP